MVSGQWLLALIAHSSQLTLIMSQARFADTLSTVAKKKKPKKFSAVQAVKEMARDRIGAPGTEQVVPDLKKKRKSSEKHKPTLGQLLQEGE